MRVLHVTLSAATGGRRDAILTLTDHLRRVGVECGLLALRNPPAELAHLAEQVDYYEGLEIAGRPTLRELADVRRVCRTRRVDLIHAHDAGSQYVASALRVANPSLRAVMTFHRTLGLESAGVRDRLRNRLTLPLIHKIVTATEERRRFFLGESPMAADRVEVIPLGVDLTTFHPEPSMRAELREELGLAPDTVLALAIGHSGPEKGIDQVVEAFAMAAARMADRPWHLALLGGGSPARLEALHQAARAQLGDRVTLAGFRTDVPRWLQAADLLVHAPRLEAFGLVVVQAMATGLPVICTAVGGLPEIIVDQETGRLVPAGDVNSVADSIVALIGDADARRRMGAAALLRAQSRYGAPLCAERHLALYQNLLSRRATRTGAAQ
ncbi:MAG: glycosyltransferase family 4 protein [Gemmatimonadales bacterium]